MFHYSGVGECIPEFSSPAACPQERASKRYDGTTADGTSVLRHPPENRRENRRVDIRRLVATRRVTRRVNSHVLRHPPGNHRKTAGKTLEKRRKTAGKAPEKRRARTLHPAVWKHVPEPGTPETQIYVRKESQNPFLSSTWPEDAKKYLAKRILC